MLPNRYDFRVKRTADFLLPRATPYDPLSDLTYGGVAAGDTSEPMLSYVWEVVTDGTDITYKRQDQTSATVVLSDANITRVSGTFDQNMRYCCAYVASGVSKLYWYNTQNAAYETTDLVGVRDPTVALDDKREFNFVNSDIILAYIKDSDNGLYYREQRDRYVTEHLVRPDVSDIYRMSRPGLRRIGMGDGYRMLFEIYSQDCQ